MTTTAFAPTCGAALARVLQEYQIAAKPAGRVAMGARTVAFPLALRSSTDLSRVIALDEAMAYRAGTESCRIARDRNAVLVEFQLPRSAWATVAIREPGSALQPKLGIDVFGRPIALNLASPEMPHVLAAGTTGSGKTTLVKALLWQMIQAPVERLQVVLIDSVKKSLRAFYGCPHLAQPAVHDASGAAALLEWTAGSMDHRTAASTQTIVVVDEISDVVATSKRAIPALARIARMGREVGMHLIAGTQYVSRETLGDPEIKANLPCRIAGRVENAQASALATGYPDLGAHRLGGSGDFVVAAAGRAIRFTAPLLTAEQLASLPAVSEETETEVLDPEPPLWAPEHVAWVLRHTWDNGSQPGREKIRQACGLGATAKAAALQGYCRDIWNAMWPESADEEVEDGQ